MKIVFLGDSLTQGTYGASYVNRVAAALHGHHFVNEGVNGDTSLNLFRRLDADVLAHQPNAVFIMIGINDALSCSEPGTAPYFRYVKGVRGGRVTPISFRENLRAVLTRLIYAQIPVWVALPPVEYRPETVRALREINQYAAEVCAELHVPTLDLMAVMTPDAVPERPPVKTLPGLWRNLTGRLLLRLRGDEQLKSAGNFTYTFDGVHLTEAGAQQMADHIVQFLRTQGVDG